MGLAQVDTGTILGTVKDQTGAVVPGAKVTIVNQGTANSISTMTRSDGTYIVTPLKIGTYRISVELDGFKKEENAAFDLNIQQQAVVDFVPADGSHQRNRAGNRPGRAAANPKCHRGPGYRRTNGRETCRLTAATGPCWPR